MQGAQSREARDPALAGTFYEAIKLQGKMPLILKLAI
jgi:hypothetical protein